MANYDAEIRVKAKVDNSEIVRLEASMESAEEKAEDLQEAVEQVSVDKSAAENAKRTADEMGDLSKKAKDAAREMSKFEAISKTATIRLNDGRIFDFDGNLIRQASDATEELHQKQTNLADTAERLAPSMKNLADETKEIAQAAKSMDPVKNTLDFIKKSFQDIPTIFGVIKGKLSVGSKEMASEWDNLSNKAAAYKQTLKELEQEDKGFGDAEYDQTYIQWQRAEQAIKDYKSNLMKTNGIQATLSNGMKRVGKSISNTFRRMLGGAKEFFSSVLRGGRTSNSVFKTMASRMKGLALSLLVFNWISKGFNAMVEGMKSGFKSLMRHSDDYANSVQSLKNSMSTLGNQFAATFAPIVQMAIPYLIQLINWINTAMNAVAQLIATLSGKDTWTRATKVQAGYNDELDNTASSAKKAFGALAKFDDLDVLQKQDDSASGSGAGGAATGGFEEVPVDNKWKNIADWLREMWENSDFYELGELLGQKLKDALDNIPWDGIKESARKIGKSIATFINGFIEVDGLGYSIGNTLAQAFNTAFEFLYSFVSNFHWSSLGTFIADGLNGVFQNIDWGLIRNTFLLGARGIADAINSFVDELDWTQISTSISNALNILSRTIYTFFDTVDWGEIGTKIGQQIMQTIEKIDWSSAGAALNSMAWALLNAIDAALEELDWLVIGESIRDFLTAIDWVPLLQEVGSMIAETLDGILVASFTALGGDGNALQKQWEEGRKIREQEREDFRTWATDIEQEAKSFTDRVSEELSNPEKWDLTTAVSTMGESWRAFIDESLSPTIDNLKQSLTDAFTALSEFILGIPEAWQGFAETYIAPLIESCRTFFVDGWQDIKEKVKLAVEDMKNSIQEKFNIIKEKSEELKKKFDDLKLKASSAFTTMKTNILNAIQPVIDRIQQFIDKVQAAIQAIKDFLNSGFEKISSFASGIGSKLSGVFSGGGVSVFASAPTAASYSMDNVPALASGSVIRGGNPFLALLGDQPTGQTNIEAPLSTIEQAVENVMSRNGYGMGGAARIVLQLNGQDVGEAMLDDLLSVMNRRGLDVEVLGVT